MIFRKWKFTDNSIIEKIEALEGQYYMEIDSNFSGLVSPKHFFDSRREILQIHSKPKIGLKILYFGYFHYLCNMSPMLIPTQIIED